MLPLESAATTIAHTAEVIATSMAESKQDPELIAQTKQSLLDAADALTDNRFPIMGTIRDTSFGNDHAGLDLSKHHALAHEVMDKTLKGVTTDVEEFCTNLIAAVKLFQTADSDAAADLKQTARLACSRRSISREHSHGDLRPAASAARGAAATADPGRRRVMAGPHEAKLKAVIDAMWEWDVDSSQDSWAMLSNNLSTASESLRKAGRLVYEGFGEHSQVGPAGRTAFATTADDTQERSTQTSKVSTAIADAYGAMQLAQTAYTAMGTAPDKPTSTVDPTADQSDPAEPEGSRQQAAGTAYDQQMADRETKAKAALDDDGQDLRRVGRSHEEHPQP